jgi:hypothetical protein
MGFATAADINRRAVYMMQDSGFASTNDPSQISTSSNLRWTTDEMLLWITDSQRALVALRPNSYNVVAGVPLVAGVRQLIPADGWLLMTVNANMVGTDYGRAVTLTTFDQMNRQWPNWRADKKNAVAYNYMFDLTDSKAFYIWPPNDGTGKVELNYSKSPPLLKAMTDTIALDDIYIPAMLQYVCAQMSLKDAEFGPGLQYNQAFTQSFMTLVMGKDAGEKEENPDAALPPQSNR